MPSTPALHPGTSEGSYENSPQQSCLGWDSFTERSTSSGILTPAALASSWPDLISQPPSYNLITQSDLQSSPLSVNPVIMDANLLESIAFSLEQFPPAINDANIYFSPNGPCPSIVEPQGQNILDEAFPNTLNRQRNVHISNGSITSSEIRPYYLPVQQSQHLISSTFKNSKTQSLQPPRPNTIKTARDASVRSDSPSSQDSDGDRLQEKRQRNKLAARRLRQKKMDRMSELESQLEKMTKERDELRLKAAKWEGEVMVLRQLLDRDTGKCS